MVYDINISILGNSTVSKTSKKMTDRIWERVCLRVEPAGDRRHPEILGSCNGPAFSKMVWYLW